MSYLKSVLQPGETIIIRKAALGRLLACDLYFGCGSRTAVGRACLLEQ